MRNNVDIIILKGAPASGKSTTAKELAKFYPEGVRLEIDNIRSMVISVKWTNQEEHINILNASVKLVCEFYKLNYKPIIVVDTFSGNKVNAFYNSLKELNEELDISIVGLYLSENELLNRLNSRSPDKFKDIEISTKINNDIFVFKHEVEFHIDTTGLTAKETAELIFKKLQK